MVTANVIADLAGIAPASVDAVTSTRAMQRRLRKNWQRLHRLVYPVAVLACCLLLWQTRSDVGEALIYIVFFAALLAWRVKRFTALQKN